MGVVESLKDTQWCPQCGKGNYARETCWNCGAILPKAGEIMKTKNDKEEAKSKGRTDIIPLMTRKMKSRTVRFNYNAPARSNSDLVIKLLRYSQFTGTPDMNNIRDVLPLLQQTVTVRPNSYKIVEIDDDVVQIDFQTTIPVIVLGGQNSSVTIEGDSFKIPKLKYDFVDDQIEYVYDFTLEYIQKSFGENYKQQWKSIGRGFLRGQNYANEQLVNENYNLKVKENYQAASKIKKIYDKCEEQIGMIKTIDKAFEKSMDDRFARVAALDDKIRHFEYYVKRADEEVRKWLTFIIDGWQKDKYEIAYMFYVAESLMNIPEYSDIFRPLTKHRHYFVDKNLSFCSVIPKDKPVETISGLDMSSLHNLNENEFLDTKAVKEFDTDANTSVDELIRILRIILRCDYNEEDLNALKWWLLYYGSQNKQLDESERERYLELYQENSDVFHPYVYDSKLGYSVKVNSIDMLISLLMRSSTDGTINQIDDSFNKSIIYLSSFFQTDDLIAQFGILQKIAEYIGAVSYEKQILEAIVQNIDHPDTDILERLEKIDSVKMSEYKPSKSVVNPIREQEMPRKTDSTVLSDSVGSKYTEISARSKEDLRRRRNLDWVDKDGMSVFDRYVFDEIAEEYIKDNLTNDDYEELYSRFEDLEHVPEAKLFSVAMRYLGIGTEVNKESISEITDLIGHGNIMADGLYYDLKLFENENNLEYINNLVDAASKGYSDVFVKERSHLYLDYSKSVETTNANKENVDQSPEFEDEKLEVVYISLESKELSGNQFTSGDIDYLRAFVGVLESDKRRKYKVYSQIFKDGEAYSDVLVDDIILEPDTFYFKTKGWGNEKGNSYSEGIYTWVIQIDEDENQTYEKDFEIYSGKLSEWKTNIKQVSTFSAHENSNFQTRYERIKHTFSSSDLQYICVRMDIDPPHEARLVRVHLVIDNVEKNENIYDGYDIVRLESGYNVFWVSYRKPQDEKWDTGMYRYTVQLHNGSKHEGMFTVY